MVQSKLSHHIVFGGMIKTPQAFSLSKGIEVPYAFKISFVVMLLLFFMFLLVCVRRMSSLGKKLLRQQVKIKEYSLAFS